MKQIEQGNSLLELMLAISLSLFISVGVITIFFHSKNTYLLAQSLNKIQTNARMAFNLLSHDIRMAGFIGCVRLMDFLPLHTKLTPNNSLVVWHNGYTTAKLALPNLSHYHSDSDVILIQSLDPHTIPVKWAKDTQISMRYMALFRPRDILLISDCQHAEVLQWGNAHLTYNYQVGSEIGFFNKIIYYIGNTGRISEGGQAIYALYRRDLNKSINKPIELVEGIKKMSIRLGMKTTADGNLYYSNSNEVKDWSKARSVEIRLLLTDDKKFQREWKYTIGLRERINDD